MVGPLPSGGSERDTAVIFVAPPSQRPLLAALTDLSASGLLAPFHWLESVPHPETDPAFRDPAVVSVSQGRVTVGAFSPVTNRYGLKRVRLVMVVPVGHPAQDSLSATAELHFQGLGVAGGAQRVCTRVLVPWSEQALPAETGHQGWNNVMLSPESTADPAYSANGWWQRPELIPGAAAVGLAAQAGICGTVPEAPKDTAPQGGSAYTEVARSFVRVTDAHAVEDSLRGLVTQVGQTYPQPIRGETQQWLSAYPDPQGRVLAAAKAWHERHQGVLRRPQAKLPAQAGERSVGAWQAITMFFSFLVKALVGAPGDWLRAKVRSVKTTVARSVANTVFGEGSKVRVVVGGVDDTGRPVGWRELSAAAAAASATLPEDGLGRSTQPVARDFGALWKDMLDGSIALLSGSGCEALGLPAYEGYVPRRSLVAPVESDEGMPPSPQLGGAGRLQPWDALEADRLRHELDAAARGSQAGAQGAREQLSRLEQWRGVCERSFIPLLGRSLETTFTQTRADITSLSERLRALVSQDLDPRTEERQRVLARLLRLLLLALVVVLGVVTVLALLETIGWALMGVVTVVAVLAWLVVSVLTFVKRQREIFHLLFQAEEQERMVPLLTANLRLAVEDLAAQGAAYAQFEQWAAIVTAFLADPLGEEDTGPTAREHETVLPAGLQRVHVEADPGHVADVAAELRAHVFRTGWLTEAWELTLRTVKEDLTPEQRTRYNNRQLDLLTEPGTPGSALSNWAQALSAKGVRSNAGQEHWERCLDTLTTPGGISLELLAVMPDSSRRRVTDYREDLERVQPHSVAQDVLAPAARVNGSILTVPEGHWLKGARDGLSETMLLVEATAPMPSSAFVYPAPERQGSTFRVDEPDYGGSGGSGAGGAQPQAQEPGLPGSNPPPFGNLEY